MQKKTIKLIPKNKFGGIFKADDGTSTQSWYDPILKFGKDLVYDVFGDASTIRRFNSDMEELGLASPSGSGDMVYASVPDPRLQILRMAAQKLAPGAWKMVKDAIRGQGLSLKNPEQAKKIQDLIKWIGDSYGKPSPRTVSGIKRSRIKTTSNKDLKDLYGSNWEEMSGNNITGSGDNLNHTTGMWGGSSQSSSIDAAGNMRSGTLWKP